MSGRLLRVKNTADSNLLKDLELPGWGASGRGSFSALTVVAEPVNAFGRPLVVTAVGTATFEVILLGALNPGESITMPAGAYRILTRLQAVSQAGGWVVNTIVDGLTMPVIQVTINATSSTVTWGIAWAGMKVMGDSYA